MSCKYPGTIELNSWPFFSSERFQLFSEIFGTSLYLNAIEGVEKDSYTLLMRNGN